ncbi:MAG: GNAT family N-acetyltransferase [Bacteroidota bacterium]
MSYELLDNPEKKRYEFQVGEHLAIAEYIKVQNKTYLTHTEVPVALEGQGIGSKLILAALQQIEKDQRELIPLCPFVAKYLKKHPEWKRLLGKNVKVE